MTADELRRRREALGLSVGQLAREFDVENSTLYRWEKERGLTKRLEAIGADVVLTDLERQKKKGEL